MGKNKKNIDKLALLDPQMWKDINILDHSIRNNWTMPMIKIPSMEPTDYEQIGAYWRIQYHRFSKGKWDLRHWTQRCKTILTKEYLDEGKCRCGTRVPKYVMRQVKAKRVATKVTI